MATDPRRLRPSELCRLLNSTPLGEVISERQLYRHRTRAGLRIGDSHHVDLLRYVAWLVSQRHAPKREAEIDPYEAVKERSRARNLALSLAGRDIGDLPNVADPARKARAAGDFRFFCDSYFPLTFHLPWSQDHLKVIARIEQAVRRPVRDGHAARVGQEHHFGVCLHLGRAVRPPRVRLPDRVGRRPRDGHARRHQDGARRQRLAP